MRARPSPGSAHISPGFSGFLTERRRAGMGTAGRQFAALLWKNWLCRLRHPVSVAGLPRGSPGRVRRRDPGDGGDAGLMWPACPTLQGTGGRLP